MDRKWIRADGRNLKLATRPNRRTKVQSKHSPFSFIKLSNVHTFGSSSSPCESLGPSWYLAKCVLLESKEGTRCPNRCWAASYPHISQCWVRESISASNEESQSMPMIYKHTRVFFVFCWKRSLVSIMRWAYRCEFEIRGCNIPRIILKSDWFVE